MTDGHAGAVPPVGVRERWVLLALTLAALVLRGWALTATALNHFDEGAYTVGALGLGRLAGASSLFPLQHHFAPPVFFGTVTLLFRLAGPSDLVAIGLNVVVGTLMVPLMWHAGRSWFGPAAGIVAAALTALNEFQIALSRTALTDTLFAFTFVLALVAIETALRRPHPGWTALAGLAVGLSWNTKYHGWFAVVVGALAVVTTVFAGHRSLGDAIRMTKRLVIIGVVAAACYLPWMLFVEQTWPGGYAELAAYQSTNLSPDWLRNVAVQAAQQDYFDGPFTRVSPLVAVLAVFLVGGGILTWSWALWSAAAGLVLIGAAFGGTAALMFCMIAAAPFVLRESDRFPAALLVGWVALFTVMSPFYHPYARLLLPFVLAMHLAVGALVQHIASTGRTTTTGGTARVAATCALVLVAGLTAYLRAEPQVWREARSLPAMTASIAEAVPPGARLIILGEPSLAFYLQLQGRTAIVSGEAQRELTRLAHLEGNPVEPVYILAGGYARRAEPLRNAVKALGPQLVQVSTYPFRPNDVRLLDDMSPRQARAFLRQPDETFDVALLKFTPAVPR